MIISSRALVFSAIPYSESSLILKAYTRQHGLASFILKGIRKGKQRAGIFRPLHPVELVYYQSSRSNLSLVKEFRSLHPLTDIQRVYEKTAIVLFLAEVLQKVIKEEESNPELYDFLENSISWLENSPEFLNFHLSFLLSLTRYLGFYPQNNYHLSTPLFDIEEGGFCAEQPGRLLTPAFESAVISKILSEPYFSQEPFTGLNNAHRRAVIRALVNYYSLQVSNFGSLKSLEVLEKIFGD